MRITLQTYWFHTHTHSDPSKIWIRKKHFDTDKEELFLFLCFVFLRARHLRWLVEGFFCFCFCQPLNHCHTFPYITVHVQGSDRGFILGQCHHVPQPYREPKSKKWSNSLAMLQIRPITADCKVHAGGKCDTCMSEEVGGGMDVKHVQLCMTLIQNQHDDCFHLWVRMNQ